MPTEPDVRETVRDRYADAARRAGEHCCTTDQGDEDLGQNLYSGTDLLDVPSGASSASLGCGDPAAIAELSEGETVLDLGSGAGIDVLLSAKKVGPTGFVYGIDMTDEMLALARKHAAEAKVTNVDFRKGYIEDIPLDDAAVDVIISNCVINLSADKPAVFTEMFRVLRPGGRIGISDIVANDELSAAERLERGSWAGCIAGALSFSEYAQGFTDAGFVSVEITPTLEVADGMHAATVRAVKPE